MKICKIPQVEAIRVLQTLNQISIAPGVDNADMYVGIGMILKQMINNAEEVEDNGRSDRQSDI